MAASKLPTRLALSLSRESRHLSLRCSQRPSRRKSSTYTGMNELSEDVEPSSTFSIPGPTEDMIQSFNPVEREKGRRRPLPPSRYTSPPFPLAKPQLTPIEAINTVPQDTTVVHFILTSHLPLPTPPPASSYPVPSPSPACNKHTPAHSLRTSSPYSTSTIHLAPSQVPPPLGSARGTTPLHTIKADRCDGPGVPQCSTFYAAQLRSATCRH